LKVASLINDFTRSVTAPKARCKMTKVGVADMLITDLCKLDHIT